ncbi:MAG: phosphate starvation-inducible protein PhoH, partial [Clostridia bacterium]|nr:phosphate starvation-inducible protein PhoH [Clostridia bacterium]
MTEKIVLTQSSEATYALFGPFDVNVGMIERAFSVRIMNSQDKSVDSGDAILVRGEEADVKSAVRVLEYLKHMIGDGEAVSQQSVEYVIGLIRDNLDGGGEDFAGGVICVTNRGKPIKPKTIGQKRYVEAIKKNSVI